MLNCFTLFSLVENELTIFNIEPMDGFVNLGYEAVFTCILKTKSKEFAVLECQYYTSDLSFHRKTTSASM